MPPGAVVAQDLDRLVEALITEQRDNVSGPRGAACQQQQQQCHVSKLRCAAKL